MEEALLPLPNVSVRQQGSSQLAGGGCRFRECKSARVRQLVSRLDLGGIEFSCKIESSDSDSIPRLDHDHSYSLDISRSSVELRAISEQGALTGCSTLAQLCATGPLPHCTITDRPRHPWRGLLVDVSRHFMELKTLRSMVELMHHFKLNVLHLHLTDDQAFRFRSEAFPDLASAQSYSKTELGKLIDFAADYAVRVVPEIDIPGHATSWLVAHPEWGSEPVDPSTQRQFGALKACLDPSREVVIESVQTILEEVIDTFPDQFVHIGGDEVDPLWWSRSESVQEWACSRELYSVRDIQADFTRHIVQFIESRDRTAVVWDEALHETLPQSVVVQAWRGMQARELSVAGGYRTIVSSPYYLDLNYHASTHYGYWPSMSASDWKSQDRRMETSDVLEHVREGIKWHQTFGDFPNVPKRSGGCILGGEACMWTELVSDELLLRRVWSRMPSVAERFWTEPSNASSRDISARLDTSLARLPKLGLTDIGAVPPIHECRTLQPLFEMLEPVKWYARMLTTGGTEERAQGESIDLEDRPYNTESALDRVVDRLPPDSSAVRRCLADVRAGRDLNVWTDGWRKQLDDLQRESKRFSDLEDLHDASQALCRLADVAEGLALPSKSLGGPFGEYLLPIAFAFLDTVNDS
ncbi:MAG: family 20 glycosylhydrolase [Gammaproteobacteria bacterium]|nr:family 20 glycosylhydrolase [Gammaproteobacteria bacterium]